MYERARTERQALTATPEVDRTRAEYEKVIYDFRIAYRLDPDFDKGPLALTSVAELYREMGRRFADAASFKTAIGAYQYLRDQFPDSSLSPDALLSIGRVIGQQPSERKRFIFPSFSSFRAKYICGIGMFSRWM